MLREREVDILTTGLPLFNALTVQPTKPTSFVVQRIQKQEPIG